MAPQMIRPLQKLVNRICHAIRKRVASISEFILDALRESMLLATKWTIYICAAASCLVMGAALYTGLITETPSSSRTTNLAELQDLGVSLTFLSSLFGAIYASPYPRAALVAPLTLAVSILGPHHALNQMTVFGPGSSQLGIFSHISLLAFAAVLTQSIWRAMSSSGSAQALVARLLGFTLVAVLVLTGAVVANVIWLGLTWPIWLGMVVYISWALVLFTGMHSRSALCVGGCGLALGLALMLPAIQRTMAFGLREWHFDDLMFQPWVYGFRISCAAISWGGSMILSLVLSLCESIWGRQPVEDWRMSFSQAWDLVLRLRRGLQTWLKLLETV